MISFPLPAVDENVNVSYKNTREEWEDVIRNVNNALNALDLQFVRQVEQEKGIPMWALVSGSSTIEFTLCSHRFSTRLT